MTRALSPLDPLAPIPRIATGNSIPINNQPWFSIGEIVQGVIWKSSNYYLRELLKGSFKSIAKEILNFLLRGEQLEYSIAGIEAYYALPTIAVCNQCYLKDGQSNSGLTWQYKVLIKGVLDGKNVCVIPKVWISERDFIPISEIKFQEGVFYKNNRNSLYKCRLRDDQPAFVYVGHIREDGSLTWDNHITPEHLTP